MQQLTQEKPATTFRESLLQLRQSLAGADPLAIATHEPFAGQALTDTIESASEAERQAMLLHALDEAIAAIEIAARLADALNSAQSDTDDAATWQLRDCTEASTQRDQTQDSTDDPVFAAYRAFTEAQPTYQDLYHYRNALAERLRTAGDGDAEV